MNESAMEPALSLRSATGDDAEAIALLTAQLGYPAEVRPIRERIDLIVPATDHILIVAEVSGKIAGWLHACVMDSIESPRRVQIEGLVVDQNNRRQRVGRRLVEYAEAWALCQSIRVVGVNSNVLRAESHGFYRELGFTVTKTQTAYRKQL